MVTSVPATKTYLPIEQVARRLKLEVGVVEALLDSHALPGLRLGSAWLVPEIALEEFLDAEFARQNPGISTIYREPAQPSGAPVKQKRKSRSHAVRVLLRGRQLDMPSYSAAAIWAIEEFAAADSTFMDRLGAVRRGKRSYVAKNRDDLYFSRPDLPAKQMRNGWWIGTNYSRAELERMLRKACEIAGLRFGLDLIIEESGSSVMAHNDRARDFVGKGHSGLGDLARRHDDYLTQS
jgi:excisionase family DNA binding protein